MKISKTQLSRLIKEEMSIMMALPTMNDASTLGLDSDLGIGLGFEEDAAGSLGGDMLPEAMRQYLGSLRCLGLWFHAAHHLTKGTGFGGDHVNIYGDIYSSLVSDFDGAAEKAVGLTANEELACPIAVTACALECMQKYESPANASAEKIASIALKMVFDHISLLNTIYDELELANELPLGLNDFLAAAANSYDTYVYLLQQRTKVA